MQKAWRIRVRLTKLGLQANVGASIVRTGFWGILYCNEEP